MIAEIVGDPRFFAKGRPADLATIAAACGAECRGEAAGDFTGVAPLQTATAREVSFLDNRRYADLLAQTKAGAVILNPSLAHRLPAGCVGLLTPEPYLAWAHVCVLFHPPLSAQPGRHASAVVDPQAHVHASAQLGPCAVIGPGAQIGAGARIEAHAVIGQGVVLGDGCVVGAGACVSHAVVGERVRIFPGARIGQDGFGFAPDGAGGYVSVPQLGRVVIEHDVEIGANTTIDRGSMHDTVIGAGCRIDNLVQIGHNVRLGRGCVIVAQVGISGSTILEDHVMVAGQAGLAGHLRVGAQARIGAQAGVMANIPERTSVMGTPCQPSKQYFRELAILRRQAQRGVSGQPHAGPID